MIPIRGKNNKKINFFIAALVLAFKIFFRPFFTFLRSLMPKKSTGMQKSHIRVVFQRLWFFGHFQPIQITVQRMNMCQRGMNQNHTKCTVKSRLETRTTMQYRAVLRKLKLTRSVSLCLEWPIVTKLIAL